MINEDQKYCRLKEIIRVEDNQLGDIERDRSINTGKGLASMKYFGRIRGKVQNSRLKYTIY